MANLLSRKIRAARQAIPLTQQDLAQRLKVTRGAVTQWESRDPDTRTAPSTLMLKKIAEVLEVPLTWLIDDNQGVDMVHAAQSRYRMDKGANPAFVAPRVEDKIIEVVREKPDRMDFKRTRSDGDYELVELKAPQDRREPGNYMLTKMFWSAAMYEVFKQRPDLQACFEVPTPLGPSRMWADFLCGDLAVEFARLPEQSFIGFHRHMGQLLLIEKGMRRPLRKHLVIWLREGQASQPDESLVATAQAADIQVTFVREPVELAAHLVKCAPPAPEGENRDRPQTDREDVGSW